MSTDNSCMFEHVAKQSLKRKLEDDDDDDVQIIEVKRANTDDQTQTLLPKRIVIPDTPSPKRTISPDTPDSPDATSPEITSLFSESPLVCRKRVSGYFAY